MVLATIYFDVTDPDGFMAVAGGAGALFEDVQGFHGMELRRGVENPAKFLLTASWDSVADHEAWQESNAPEFLGALGPYTDGGPTIEHFE